MDNRKINEEYRKDSLTLSLVVAILRRDIKGIEDDPRPEEWMKEALHQEQRILELLTDEDYLAEYAKTVLVEDVD